MLGEGLTRNAGGVEPCKTAWRWGSPNGLGPGHCEHGSARLQQLVYAALGTEILLILL